MSPFLLEHNYFSKATYCFSHMLGAAQNRSACYVLISNCMFAKASYEHMPCNNLSQNEHLLQMRTNTVYWYLHAIACTMFSITTGNSPKTFRQIKPELFELLYFLSYVLCYARAGHYVQTSSLWLVDFLGKAHFFKASYC